MRLKASFRLGVCLLGVTAGPVVVGSGSGCGSAGTGTVAKPTEEQAKRYRQMEDYMKTQKPLKNQRPAR